MDQDELDDRFLAEGTLAQLRDHWRLDSFLDGNHERRSRYFAFVRAQVAAFTKAARAPNDACLRDVVVLALKRDRSYRVFLAAAGARKELKDTGSWEDLLLAGAGTILTQYLRTIEP